MKLPNQTHAFRVVFITTTLLTLLSGGGSLWLAQNEELTPHQTRIFETLTTTWTMGVGAVIGLLGSQDDE